MQLVMKTFVPCMVLAAVRAVGAENSLRQPQKLMSVNAHKDDQLPTAGIFPPAEKADDDRRLMDAISQFRAEVCAQMKDEHGKKFATFKDCQKFMNDACNPGKDKRMDGDGHEVTSGKGYCEEYFPEAEKKAKAKIKKEDEEKAKAPVHKVVAGPSPGPAPAPAGKAPAAAAPSGAAPSGASAPAPSPMSGPAPGPVPGPFTPGLSGNYPWVPVADDEKYYYKADGKDPSRLHMTESLKLPTQGYWGKLVEHEDGKTSISDWGKEFGPQSANGYCNICRAHPDNAWCRQNCFRHHSGAFDKTALLLPLVCAVAALRVF